MEIVPHIKLIEAAGGTPVPMPMLELYTALQTKVVDGAENTISNILSSVKIPLLKIVKALNGIFFKNAFITSF